MRIPSHRLLLLAVVASTLHAVRSASVALGVDYPVFLSDHDLVWDFSPSNASSFVPRTWYTGAIGGGGVLGFSARWNDAAHGLRIDIARTDAWACQQRQPIGWFVLSFAGVVQKFAMRQRLAALDLVINVTTSIGAVGAVMYSAAADAEAIVIDVASAGSEAPSWTYYADTTGVCNPAKPVSGSVPLNISGATALTTQQYVGGGSFTTAFTFLNSTNGGVPVAATPCAPHVSMRVAAITGADGRVWTRDALGSSTSASIQALGAGANVSRLPSVEGVCFRPVLSSLLPPSHVLLLTVANSQRTRTPNASTPAALETLVRVITGGFPALRAAHDAWWTSFWAASFVSASGAPSATALEGLHAVSMARYAAGGRAGMHDLMGVSGPGGVDLCLGPWCQNVWDMNVQVMPLHVHMSNRNAALFGTAMDQFGTWVASGGGSTNSWTNAVGSNMDTGDGLLWMSRNLHRHALATGNVTALLSVVYPILVIALDNVGGTYRAYSNDTSGVLHVPAGCVSPEFVDACSKGTPYPSCSDCNYQLSMRRWGLTTAVAIATAHNLTQPRLPVWTDILSHLAPHPVDAHGLRISAEAPFYKPHRHYSHLLSLFDLAIAGAGSDEGKAPPLSAAAAGLDNWWNITCAAQQRPGGFMEECRGFTQAGMAIMSALLNRTAAATGNLTALIHSVITPNGMYGEMVFQGHPDEYAPVSESAFAAAAGLQSCLLNDFAAPPAADGSPGGAAAVPLSLVLWPGATWPNASFFNLRTRGALLVSAVRLSGATAFVGITAPSGGGDGVSDTSAPPSSGPSSVGSGKASSGPSSVDVLLHVPDWASGTTTPSSDPSDAIITPATGQPGSFHVSVPAGTTVVLYVSGAGGWSPPQPGMPFVVSAAPGSNSSEHNYWGYRWNMTMPFH